MSTPEFPGSVQEPGAGEKNLYAMLDGLGIAHRTFEHIPVFTVEESRAVCAHISGCHTKNLCLKDRRGSLWLVIAREHVRIDLNALAKLLDVARFSFGAAELLTEVLGVPPGSVTPFALMNDREGRVRVVLDKEMLESDPLNFHPLRNDRTTAIAPDGLLKFIDATRHAPLIAQLPER
jgi:Ala-tRNA(Pro) deacylase